MHSCEPNVMLDVRNVADTSNKYSMISVFIFQTRAPTGRCTATLTSEPSSPHNLRLNLVVFSGSDSAWNQFRRRYLYHVTLGVALQVRAFGRP